MLIVIDPNGQRREIPLLRERLVIGRRPDSDVVLDDAAVSSRHAAIISLQHDLLVEDLGSTNGTRVNGRLVAKQLLSGGDEVLIGRHTLRITAGPPAADRAPPPPASAPQAPPAGVLRIDSGPQAGREIPLDKPLATIGKPGIQVAAITRRADGYFVVDAGRSSGATRPALLNGAELGHQARRLQPGDVLEIAGARMVFELL